jgi:formylglycine-generating enzyme
LDFVPSTNTGCNYDPADLADYPVTCVNWCQANAYCAWAGKRLCSGIGGAVEDGAVGTSEWIAACSKNGLRDYPYGNVYDPAACRVETLGDAGVSPVGSFPKCDGGFDGIMDMSGNAFEWTTHCDLSDAASHGSNSVSRGGSGFEVGGSNNDFKCTASISIAIDNQARDIGLRCCAR